MTEQQPIKRRLNIWRGVFRLYLALMLIIGSVVVVSVATSANGTLQSRYDHADRVPELIGYQGADTDGQAIYQVGAYGPRYSFPPDVTRQEAIAAIQRVEREDANIEFWTSVGAALGAFLAFAAVLLTLLCLARWVKRGFSAAA